VVGSLEARGVGGIFDPLQLCLSFSYIEASASVELIYTTSVMW